MRKSNRKQRWSSDIRPCVQNIIASLDTAKMQIVTAFSYFFFFEHCRTIIFDFCLMHYHQEINGVFRKFHKTMCHVYFHHYSEYHFHQFSL